MGVDLVRSRGVGRVTPALLFPLVQYRSCWPSSRRSWCTSLPCWRSSPRRGPTSTTPVPPSGYMQRCLARHAPDAPDRLPLACSYGPTDQFNSDWRTGSCRCWGPDSYRKDTPCFDSIAAPAHITAVNTNGGDFTATCGTCLAVACVPGPTRGLDWSTYSTPGCIGNATVFVQVTDSCPCLQNPSNVKWCCNETATITRHLDLSTPAFSQIADVAAGVIDVLYQVVIYSVCFAACVSGPSAAQGVVPLSCSDFTFHCLI